MKPRLIKNFHAEDSRGSFTKVFSDLEYDDIEINYGILQQMYATNYSTRCSTNISANYLETVRDNIPELSQYTNTTYNVQKNNK